VWIGWDGSAAGEVGVGRVAGVDEMTVGERFLALHRGDGALVLPNAWDVGSAKVLVDIGFSALATTSSGFAATLGRLDGSVTRDEAVEHGRALSAAVDVPVSADLEGGFADDLDGIAETYRLAAASGLAGGSIEDATGRPDDPVHPVDRAVEQVAAAAEAAHADGRGFVLTARAENFLYGRTDLADTIDRLQRYQEAGADVLYAPGVIAPDDIRALVTSVDRPVNVLALADAPTVAELSDLCVARVSVGGGLAFAALGALVAAARELLEQGTYNYRPLTTEGAKAARRAFR
jgi:2-methylisocitrate lyase-like PEP mutase family enzyme